MKVISYELKIAGVKVAIDSGEKLKAAIKLLNKELDRTKDIDAYKEIQKDLGVLKGLQQEVRDETRKNQKAFVESNRAAAGSYDQLQLRLTRLKREYKELGAEARKGIGGQKLKEEIRGISSELKNIDSGLGDNFRNVGNYANGIKGVFGALKGGLLAAGISVGLQEINQAIQASVRLFADFKDQIAILQAVTNSSTETIARLEAEARRLGETTQFTAGEVVQLQTNFARLGFSTDEIEQATESTLNLSIATGEDLADSAEVAAQTLRAYNLSAEEMGRVNDVIAKSFNVSALNLERFTESSKLVAPVAAQAGVEIEQVTAILGTLADVGLSGSVAGTGLRRTFLELVNPASKLSQQLGVTVTDAESFNEALAALEKQQIGVGEAAELVGVNAATAFTVFANSVPKIREVTDALNNAGEGIGAAGQAAAIVSDTLQGDIRRFNSALEGFQLNLVDVFEGTLRSAVSGAAGAFDPLLNVLKDLFEIFSPLIDEVKLLFAEIAEGAGQTNILEYVLRLVRGTLVLLVNIISTNIRRIRELIAYFNDAAQSGSTLGNVINFLNGFFNFLRDAISRIPGVLNGMINALVEAQDQLVNWDFDGSRITEAFNEGYEAAVNFRKEAEAAVEETGKAAALSADQVKQLADQVEQLAAATGLSAEKIKKIQDKFAGKDFETIVNLTAREAFRRIGATGGTGGDTPGGGRGGAAAEEVLDPASLEGMQQKLRKLNEELSKTSDVETMAKTLREIADTEAGIEELQKQIDILKGNLRGLVEEAVEFVDADVEPVEIIKVDVDRAFIDRLLEDTEKAKQEVIAKLNELGLSEEKYQKERERIDLEFAQQRLATELGLAEQGSAEYLRIKNAMYENEVALAKAKNSKLTASEREFLEKVKDLAFEGVQNLFDARFESERERLEQEAELEIENLDRRLALRLEGVERGSLEEARILAEGEAQKIAIQREAAKEKKKLDIKQAIINTALAIGNALATVQPFIPNALIAAAIAAIRGAAQVAAISSQTFAKGGVVEGPSHSRGGVPARVAGVKIIELEGGEGILNKAVMRLNRVVSMKGTPAQIASNLNQMAGGGVPFKSVGPARRKFQFGGLTAPIPLELLSQASPGGQVMVVAELTEDSVTKVGSAVAEGSYKGSRQGSAEAIDTSRRASERQEALQRRTNV